MDMPTDHGDTEQVCTLLEPREHAGKVVIMSRHYIDDGEGSPPHGDYIVYVHEHGAPPCEPRIGLHKISDDTVRCKEQELITATVDDGRILTPARGGYAEGLAGLSQGRFPNEATVLPDGTGEGTGVHDVGGPVRF